MKFFFLFVCVVASKGADSDICACSNESIGWSQTGHFLSSRFSWTSLVSKLSLHSDSLSGRLYKVLTGEFVFEVLLLLDDWSQLCDFAEALSTDDCRLLRGLQTGKNIFNQL